MSTPATPVFLDEAAARRVLLVQAFEAAPGPIWTVEDSRWATRVARDAVPAGATPARFLGERAHHALRRLLPRSAEAARLLQRRAWRWRWAAAALLLGFVCGLAIDIFGGSQRIDLLGPTVWAVVGWNVAVYLGLLLPHPARLRQRLARWIGGRRGAGVPALLAFRAAWMRQAAPLLLARAAILLHAAAAALALGLIAGLYLRGLVLDYRAGWQSTFLDAPQVQWLLSTLLAPARALTGIVPPDVAPLRVGPDTPAGAGAAPWIHLYAATLVLAVVLPRTLLLLAAAWRQARPLRLVLDEPYFQRLLREQQGRTAQVQVLALDAAPSPHVLACLQALLAPALGDAVQLLPGPGTAYGQEEEAARIAVPAGATLRIALMDLSATPEDDRHGAFVRALRGPLPLLVLADEAAFVRRFANAPERLAQRRQAWRQWAAQAGVALATADLARPDAAAVEPALQAALQAA